MPTPNKGLKIRENKILDDFIRRNCPQETHPFLLASCLEMEEYSERCADGRYEGELDFRDKLLQCSKYLPVLDDTSAKIFKRQQFRMMQAFGQLPGRMARLQTLPKPGKGLLNLAPPTQFQHPNAAHLAGKEEWENPRLRQQALVELILNNGKRDDPEYSTD